MNRIDVPGTLREMWDTRPARPRNDRQVAGVASAIARRYDIDPVLVRVGFIVTAFLGIGAALYIAGWIALPEEPRDPTAPAGPPQRGFMTVAVVIAAIVTVVTFIEGDDRSDSILTLLVVAGLLFLLHRSRGDRNLAPSAAQAAAPPPAAGVSLVKDAGSAPTEQMAAGQMAAGQVAADAPAPLSPPAWDPLGAAPFAWDLPEPGPAHPPAPPVPARHRAPVTSVTFGLTLLAGGLTAVILLFNHALTFANAEIVAGVMLSVLGAGLVIGAFMRAGRGLIPIAVLMGMLTWALLAVPDFAFRNGAVGNLNEAPKAVAELAATYERAAGDIRLDLRNLDLAVPAGGADTPVRTAVSLGAGTIEVILPPNADVEVNASSGLGSVTFGTHEASGPGADIHVATDLGADGVRSGRLLVLDIEEGAGDVEVRRG